MDVPENSGFSPQIIHFNRDFHYKSSIIYCQLGDYMVPTTYKGNQETPLI